MLNQNTDKDPKMLYFDVISDILKNLSSNFNKDFEKVS